MFFLLEFFFKRLILLIFVSFPLFGHAQDLRLAVASNFANSAKELVRHFSAQTGYQVSVSTASTGKFYAQISQAAPFDILLAADRQTPEKLIKDGLAVQTSLLDYARGRLVFVATKTAKGQTAEDVLRKLEFKKLAIANPELAPYGKAALQTLEHLGLQQRAARHLVLAENIGQAAQFVLSGNADAGFLPQALVLEARQTQKIVLETWLIPDAWHAPIIQSAVLLNRGRNNAAALAFMTYLKSDAARSLIHSHGYD